MEYRQNLKLLKLFLGGRRQSLNRELKQLMQQFSKDQKFERAAEIRDQINALEQLAYIQSGQPVDLDLPVLELDDHLHQMTLVRQLLNNYGLIPANYPINRVEAYDISNISGTDATASMVVFINGKPDTSEYRHFRMKYTTGPNDPGMMTEALTRRLNHPEWDYPDLIVIDGGRTQLNAAFKVIKGQVPTISLVKHPDRLLFKTQSGFLSYRLHPGSPIANLFQHLRDESHRFAKKYHHTLARKRMTSFSPIDT
jgi:excinuclease ABC subunit C